MFDSPAPRTARGRGWGGGGLRGELPQRYRGRRLVHEVHRPRAESDRLPDDDVLRHTVQVVDLTLDCGPQEMVGCNLKRPPGEDGGLAARDAVGADRLSLPPVRPC